jgi:hypothetical protein
MESESESESIRVLIKQCKILRMSGDSMIANIIVYIKSLCNKTKYVNGFGFSSFLVRIK